MHKALIEEFTSPPAKYRGKPFWAWNGRLDPEELRQQIRIMHAMGLGGFFMHSRVGLGTKYLSREWFECVRACIDEAKKLGMEAWLYDEDRWPSGAAGGLVTKNPQYRMRSVTMLQIRNPRQLKWNANTLAAFVAKVKGSEARGLQRIARGKRPSLSQGQCILIFRVEMDPPSSWYNGCTYLDTLNHQAVKKFIEVTHESYRRRIGKHFGRVVPGIFTDEPNHGGKFMDIGFTGCDQNLPWTAKLPSVFRKRYGYDILDHLPELFLRVNGQAVTPARHNYHDCVTFLFVDAFARQIGQWCQRNKLKHTGHVLLEETLSSQTSVVGSCMRFYEYMQTPGMDLLTAYNREYDTAKQVSSAARQFGRKWRLTETYGCTGWDFPFAGHKALGDWQLALGINLRCQHLSWYTMAGQAKRDYPASISYQSPWWELYSTVEDYFARLHAVMTRGQEVRDLLVIHPVESMWVLCERRWKKNPAVERYDIMLEDLRDTLLAANIDFDYGDEDILARHGMVTKTSGRTELAVAKARYKAVVVPPLITMRRTTLAILERFKAAGGTVIFAGQPAQYVDASPLKLVQDFAANCVRVPAKGNDLVRAVELTCRRVSITNLAGRQIAPALHLLREDKDAFYLFVCNTGHDFRRTRGDIGLRDRKEAFGEVQISGFGQCNGRPLELDPQTGNVFQAKANRKSGKWRIDTSLHALGSRLFLIPKTSGKKVFPKQQTLKNIRVRKLNPASWDIVLSECNNLVLDRPRYKIGTGPWREADEILRVDRAVRRLIKIPQRGGMMVQPWARARSKTPKTVPVELLYTFEVKSIPSGDLFLAVEQPALYKVFINTTPISSDAECGWWTDKSLRRIRLNPCVLQRGRNEIRLKCNYNEDHDGLEMIYLQGFFGTTLRGTDVAIAKMPSSLKLGNWVNQRLPFYSGSLSYSTTIPAKLSRGQRLFVRVPSYRGTAVRVLVNGKSAGLIGWEPNEVDITDFLEDDKVRLAIEIIGHRRNSHGPLHLNRKQPKWTGPNEFMTSHQHWTDSYQLVPCGLMEPPWLIVRR